MFGLSSRIRRSAAGLAAGSILATMAAGSASAQAPRQPAPMEPPKPSPQQPAPMKPPTPSPQQPAPMAAPEPAPLMQQIAAKRAEIEELGEDLQEIQQATMAANPDLAAQRDELVTLVDTKMVEAGHDPDASRDRIESLQGQLRDQETPQSDRQRLSGELRQEVTTLRQAQGEAMQDAEVQAQQASLNDELVAAMQEQDPETQALIGELQAARQEYRQLAARAQQQGGMPRGN